MTNRAIILAKSLCVAAFLGQLQALGYTKQEEMLG